MRAFRSSARSRSQATALPAASGHTRRRSHPGRRRPRRPLRSARLHRLPRPLPDLGARPASGPARRRDVARGGTRAGRAPTPRTRRVDPRARLARWRLAAPGLAHEGGARRGHGRHARGAPRPRLPLALAQLRGTRARERRPRGRWRSRRARRAGRADGRPSRGGRWRFKDRYLSIPDDEYVDAMRDALRVAAARGVTCVHDKDGWLGAVRLWQRLRRAAAR